MADNPTTEQTIRAVLNEIRRYKTRAGEIFPIVQVTVKLQEQGFTSDEVTGALEVMVQDELLEPSNNPHWKLTEKGYAQV